MVMVALNSRARKGGKDRGEVNEGSMEKFEGKTTDGNADYGVMVQPSQQHVAPYVKGVEWGLGTRSLRIVAAFWAGINIYIYFPLY